jgi:hypothetical protein
MEQARVTKAVNIALSSVTGLERMEEDSVESQVAKLAEGIQ